MREITKAQITIGLLAFFATVWEIIINRPESILTAAGLIILQLILLLILAYVIIALLEWVKVFDLKTNAILTLFVLVTIRLLTAFQIVP